MFPMGISLAIEGLSMRKDPKEYLYANLDFQAPSGCWNWTGNKNDRGYGTFRNRIMGDYMGFKKATAASRASWVIHNGLIAANDWVLHKCDNPACCNPAHLYIGTPQQNVDDMVSRERNSRGEDRPAAILKEADIREIRRLRGKRSDKHRVKVKELAEMFSVSPHTIKHVIYGEAWTHVE
jgi:hypothetical protein